MRTLKKLALAGIALLALGAAACAGPGAAIAIVYDTSGSMAQRVPAAGGPKQKYVIASQALEKISTQIDAFAKAGNKVQAGIVTFPGTNRSAFPVPFGDWDREAFGRWLNDFKTPQGGTPLGEAVLSATKLAADSPLPKKHVVVLTDGENNAGIATEEGVRKGRAYAKTKGAAAINFYFIAFDTSAKQFDGVKKEGAVVLSANNESELQKGLVSIFAEKILLENE